MITSYFLVIFIVLRSIKFISGCFLNWLEKNSKVMCYSYWLAEIMQKQILINASNKRNAHTMTSKQMSFSWKLFSQFTTLHFLKKSSQTVSWRNSMADTICTIIKREGNRERLLKSCLLKCELNILVRHEGFFTFVFQWLKYINHDGYVWILLMDLCELFSEYDISVLNL